MIVADNSALISLATVDLFEAFIAEFDVHTTETVVDEIEQTSEYDDLHGEAAETVLNNMDGITVHRVQEQITSSRVDRGEGSCAVLTEERDVDFLITDDLRALPELQAVTGSKVAISPIVLKALIQRDAITREEALGKLDELAEQRDWLGAPIYRRAKNLFN